MAQTVLSLKTLILGAVSTLSPQVILGNTTLIGRNVPTYNQEFFGGIPFAKPPIGDLRLEPPVLQTVLNDSVFDASEFGTACIEPLTSINETSEDCLTVNVLRPAGLSAESDLPVIVWIHGGGFKSGSASRFQYDGGALVAESVSRGTPIIYVSFNYRLGPLGFPTGAEAASKGSLNLGLRDQVTALQWVQENIGLFGGDKEKVTVFGERAGAVSIAIHMLRPEFSALARAAILQSGSAATGPVNVAEVSQSHWDRFVQALPSCFDHDSQDTFACVRDADEPSLLQAYEATLEHESVWAPWSPVLDGIILPDLPSRVLSAGSFARIPIIAGTNLDEGTISVGESANESMGDEWLSRAFLPPLVDGEEFNKTLATLKDVYPDDPALGSPFGTGNETFGLDSAYKRLCALLGDLFFQAQRRLFTQQAAAHEVPAWAYLFTEPESYLPARMGVPHSAEIAYVFGHVGHSRRALSREMMNYWQSKRDLSRDMMNYWLSFATSLTPNDGRGSSRPIWTQYVNDDPALLRLHRANITIILDDFRADQIAFINEHSAVFHQ